MNIVYDHYQYRLYSDDPVYSIMLPKDLKWEDEFGWNPVAQVYEYSTEGNLLIQESTKKAGRHITLVGLADMAWLSRQEMQVLIQMRNHMGLVMNLTFFDTKNSNNVLFTHKVMFRHMDNAIEYHLIKQWDQYEEDAWHIIDAIRLMEVV